MKPSDLDLPFPDWRKYQEEIILRAGTETKDIILIEGPTGAGKSGIAVGISRFLQASKSAIVCSTIQLQIQYLKDHPSLKTVKGRANFPCLVQDTNADEGPCTVAGPRNCKRHDECPYYNQVAEGISAPISIHNYSYWLLSANNLGRFSGLDALFLDEAHLLEDNLRKFVQVEVSQWSARRLLHSCPVTSDYHAWKRWASDVIDDLGDEASASYHFDRLTPSEIQRILNVRSLFKKAATITNSVDEDWLIDEMGKTWVLRPTWVDKFGQSCIFDHVSKQGGKVILMSATILDAELFCQGLGVNPDKVAFYRMPSTFPKERRPIIYRPIVKVNHSMSDTARRSLVRAVDKVLSDHPNEKGLIHTANYDLARFLVAESKYKDRLVTHSTKDRADVLDYFKSSSQPLVLVSPSFTTGVDLPYDLCRFNIIMKLPFPNKADSQVERRMKLGPDGLPNIKGQKWYMWTTACSLVQSTGRGMRSADDRCTNYILDANFTWFRNAVNQMLPTWWKEALREESDTDFIVSQLRDAALARKGGY